jgi:hypothetical protein
MANEAPNDDKVVDKDEVAPEGGDDTTPEMSEAESKARELGWRPKEEYTGTKKWVDAEEFLDRQELYETIHKSNRKVKKLEKVVETLNKHHTDTYEAAYKQALETLKAERKQAAKDNDVERVVEIDEKIEEVKETRASAKAADDGTNGPAPDPVFDAWREKNEWYGEDEDMSAYADGYAAKLIAKVKSGALDLEWKEVLAEVAKKTQDTFRHKSKNPNREEPSRVGKPRGADATPRSKGKLPTFQDLPKEAKEMYKVLVKTEKNPYGTLTSEQYLKDYALKAGLLKEDTEE